MIDVIVTLIQVKKAKVEPKSLLPRYRYAYLTGLIHVCNNVLRKVRQTHLHWEKLGISFRIVNLSEGELFTGSSRKTSLDLSKG